MSFPFNNNNSNKKPKSVNTRNRRLSNISSPMASLMELGYWDSMVTVRIHPALPKEMQSDTKKYDDENFLQSSISPVNILILIEGIEEKVIPAIKQGENAQVNVIIGGDTVFQVATKNIEGKQITLATIAKGLDATTRKPTSVISYHFAEKPYLESYDYTSGEFEAGDDKLAELNLFLHHLKAHTTANTNAFVHAHRVVDRIFREKLLGETPSGYTNNSGSTNSVFSGGGSNTTSTTETFSTEKLDNPDALSKFMDM